MPSDGLATVHRLFTQLTKRGLGANWAASQALRLASNKGETAPFHALTVLAASHSTYKNIYRPRAHDAPVTIALSGFLT